MSGPPLREAYRYLGSADERFRADARSRIVWSTLAAGAMHGLVFFGTPSWISPISNFVPKESEQAPIEWLVINLPAARAAEIVGPQWNGDGSGMEVVVGGDSGEGVGSQTSAGDIAGVSDELREVLLGSSLVPSLAEPEPDQGSPEQPDGSGSIQLEGGASTVDLAGLAAADSLALELLSALRPELVVLNPSTWILIRNPTVVENFMRQRASNIPDLNGSRRSTSVALWISEAGSVEWAEVSQSSGRTDLDELALQLFSEVATFRPARDRGVRVPTTAIFTVHFPW